MVDFIIYTAEVSICMFLFFSVWILFLKKETFNRLNRIYLLSSFILSFLIPILNINYSIIDSSTPTLDYISSIMLENIVVVSYSNAVQTIDWILMIYLLVVMILFIRFSVKIGQLFSFRRHCKTMTYKGIKFYVADKKIAPFSFNKRIFFHKEDINKADFNEIFQHELTHVKEKHSFDIILSELTGIIQWFNPMIYIYKKHLKTLHEYLSDEKVILQGFEPDEYKMLLIERQIGDQFRFANYFNKSLTIKRINMIKRIKSQNKAKYKLLTAVPILILTILLFSLSGNTYVSDTDIAPEVKDSIYMDVDEPAVYPGGNLAMRKYIAMNVKFPDDARKNGISGTVYVKFTVDKKGKVGKVSIQKGVSESLDKESIRVVKSLPDFEKPAYKEGKPVEVFYITPITYKLN